MVHPSHYNLMPRRGRHSQSIIIIDSVSTFVYLQMFYNVESDEMLRLWLKHVCVL